MTVLVNVNDLHLLKYVNPDTRWTSVIGQHTVQHSLIGYWLICMLQTFAKASIDTVNHLWYCYEYGSDSQKKNSSVIFRRIILKVFLINVFNSGVGCNCVSS